VKSTPNKHEPEQDDRVPPLNNTAPGRNVVAAMADDFEVPPAPKKPEPEQDGWAPPTPGKYDVAAKADDAEVPVHLRNHIILISDRAVTRSQTRAIEVMQRGYLRW
jgi:hypothetical protein